MSKSCGGSKDTANNMKQPRNVVSGHGGGGWSTEQGEAASAD